MTAVEAELFNQAFSMAGSGIGGYFAGWGCGKVIKLVMKVAAAVVGIFFAAIMYMQSQGILRVDWVKIQAISDNAVNSVVNSTVITDSVSNDGGIYHNIVGNLGIPVTLGIGFGFFMGLSRGLRG